MIFNNNDMDLKKVDEFGVAFNYPRCCIDYFKDKCSSNDFGCVPSVDGFVPCPRCRAAVLVVVNIFFNKLNDKVLNLSLLDFFNLFNSSVSGVDFYLNNTVNCAKNSFSWRGKERKGTERIGWEGNGLDGIGEDRKGKEWRGFISTNQKNKEEDLK